MKIPITNQPNAYVLVRGPDNEIGPLLIQELKNAGKNIIPYRGVVDMSECPQVTTKGLSETIIDDQGIPSKVIDMVVAEIEKNKRTDFAFYNFGPDDFIRKAIDAQLELASLENIFIYENGTFSSLRSRNL